ncbi:CDP-glycerol glycerophosphotransferase family protein [Streptacidiphilus monticola]
MLRHGHYAQTHTHPAEAVDGRLLVKLPAVPNPAWNGDVPLLSGRWRLFVRLPVDADAPSGETGEEQRALEVRAKIAPTAQGTLPLEVEARGRTVRLRRHNYDALLLEVESSVPVGERGGFHRRRMREEVYPAARSGRCCRRCCTTSSAAGTTRTPPGDPPGVPAPRHGTGTPVGGPRPPGGHPPGARTVVFDSSEWYEAYARSRFVVGNTHFPAWLAARPEQVVVQTWHGTPLKRIGFDFDNDWFADTDYLEELRREVPQWRLLLAPNRFSTPVFRRAFRYEGEILESGYPRNDLLLAPDRELRARRVREALGLPEGRRVVLYAPTWREDQARPSGGYQLDLRLDLPLLRSRLGGDHVLLVRPHAHVGDHVPGAGDGFVWDVGSYPDIADLYLVADVLLTDYSSTMFDFAVTGRPMLFFTYDLDRYRDVLRGFYFDFEAQAPGPLLATTEEVVDALLHLDRVAADSAASYAAFRARYCDLDDGQAARRVVDRMLELWRDGR